jgi:hypothetical protein
MSKKHLHNFLEWTHICGLAAQVYSLEQICWLMHSVRRSGAANNAFCEGLLRCEYTKGVALGRIRLCIDGERDARVMRGLLGRGPLIVNDDLFSSCVDLGLR